MNMMVNKSKNNSIYVDDIMVFQEKIVQTSDDLSLNSIAQQSKALR